MGEAVPARPEAGPNIYRRETNGRSRIPVVAFAGFVPPSILLVASCLDLPVNVPVMSGLCLAVFALIYLRMMWLIETDHRADQRDRGARPRPRGLAPPT